MTEEQTIGSWNRVSYNPVLDKIGVEFELYQEVLVALLDAFELEYSRLDSVLEQHATVEDTVTSLYPRVVIWYHGTDRAYAKDICKYGFQPNTYFARHLEDAVTYGGNYIFEVMLPYFPPPQWKTPAWQVRLEDPVPVSKIVSHYRITKSPIFENAELREQVFASNQGQDDG